MQKFFEFKKNNKHLLFVISFLILSITSITQFYFLEGSIFNFFYQPFLINFFGLSTIIFLFWLLGLIITIYYLSINSQFIAFFNFLHQIIKILSKFVKKFFSKFFNTRAPLYN